MNAPTEISPPGTLPILTFEQAALGPSLGYVFDPRWLDPYESLVSILWKFAWVNGLAGHLVVGHVARRPVDPYEGVSATAEEIDVRRVARSLGVTAKTVRAACRRSRAPVLQFCGRCMWRGYHGVVHQFGPEARCPVHGRPLEKTCRSCGKSSAWHLDARLLDAPFRCAHCGRRYATADFVNRKPLSMPARTALTRTFLDLRTPLAAKAAGRRQ